jgi:hypothetical protein
MIDTRSDATRPAIPDSSDRNSPLAVNYVPALLFDLPISCLRGGSRHRWAYFFANSQGGSFWRFGDEK